MSGFRAWFRGVLILLWLVWGFLMVLIPIPLMGFLGHRRKALGILWIQQRWCERACRFLNVRITVSGEIHSKAGLWVANHISWLDILVIGSIRPGFFLAKQEVANWPALGWLARGIGTLFIRRGDPQHSAEVQTQMIHHLHSGKPMVIFPEGTTSDGSRVLRFHSRLFRPAEMVGVLVQPLGLHYEGAAQEVVPFVGDDAFVPHLLTLLKEEVIEVKVQAHGLIPETASSGEMARHARETIQNGIQMQTRSSALSSSLISLKTLDTAFSDYSPQKSG